MPEHVRARLVAFSRGCQEGIRGFVVVDAPWCVREKCWSRGRDRDSSPRIAPVVEFPILEVVPFLLR
jgi:hypothetical protein